MKKITVWKVNDFYYENEKEAIEAEKTTQMHTKLSALFDGAGCSIFDVSDLIAHRAEILQILELDENKESEKLRINKDVIDFWLLLLGKMKSAYKHALGFPALDLSNLVQEYEKHFMTRGYTFVNEGHALINKYSQE